MGASQSVLSPALQAIVESTESPIPARHGDTNPQVIPMDSHLWEAVWSGDAFDPSQVFTLFTIADIRAWKEKAPKNLSSFIRRAVLKLHFASGTAIATTACQTQVNNVFLLLTRLLPVVFEDPEWAGFFWTPLPTDVPMSMVMAAWRLPDGHTQIPDPKANNHPPITPFAVTESTPLAHVLMGSILDFMFAPGYTVERTQFSRHFFMSDAPQAILPVKCVDPSKFIWAPGIGCTIEYYRPALAQSRVRALLVRLMTVCLSSCLYNTPEAHHPKTIAFFQSILNTFVGYDPIGFGLPYNYAFAPDGEHQTLVEMCGVLTAAIISSHSAAAAASSTSLPAWLAGLKNAEDLTFLCTKTASLLNNPHTATWFPGSMQRVHYHQELMVVFWRLCELNAAFVQHCVATPEALLHIVAPILYHINQCRLDPTRMGLLHVGIYTLLLLSGDRGFAVRLNTAYDNSVVFEFPSFSGNYADLLVLVIHNLMVGTNQRLVALYDCLLTIVANISPYTKNLGLVPANKLVHLFELFSTPSFLFASEGNHHLVFFLLEIFNNLIQYQYEGNHHLTYIIIRRRKAFVALQKLSLLPPQTAPVPEPSSATHHTHATAAAAPAAGLATAAAEPGASAPGDASAAIPDFEPSKAVVVSSLPREEQGEHFSVVTKPVVQSWHRQLPLETIIRCLQVEALCARAGGVTDEVEIIEFLRQSTLVGLLPLPHPIVVRKYHASAGTMVWLLSFVWGLTFLKHLNPPIWHGTTLNLLIVKETTS